MKKIFLFALALASFASCQNDKPAAATAATNTETTSQTEQTKPEANPANNAQNFAPANLKQTVAPGSPVIGSPGDAISPQTIRVINSLSTDYWEIEAYLRMALEKEERIALSKENTGRWFKFSPDGNFVAGKYQEETGKGKWFYSPKLASLYFDHDERRDEEFTIKMNSEETVMIWVGTSTFDESGVQAKLGNSTDLPTGK